MPATQEISLGTSQNEAVGYARRFKMGSYSGCLIFGFDGDRGDREFYLTMSLDLRQMGLEEAYVTADSVVELIDFMNDDEDMRFFLETL